MKNLILYFILLLLATLLGAAISMHSGYVLIGYGAVTIETTLWVAVLGVFCCFLILYALLRCSSAVHNLQQNIENYCHRQRAAKAQRLFDDSLQKLLMGDWVKAEKILAQSIALQEQAEQKVALSSYLTAAYAASKQDNPANSTQFLQRDRYLDAAQKIYGRDKKACFTISLCRLRLLLQNNQREEAYALLCSLRQSYRKHRKLLQKIQTTHLRYYDFKNSRT